MSIGGAKDLDEVTRQSFANMADEIGMRPKLILGRLDSMAKRIVPMSRKVELELRREWPSDVYAEIEKIIAIMAERVKG